MVNRVVVQTSLRLLLAVSVLAVIAWQLDLAKIGDVLSHTRVSMVVAAVLLCLTQHVINSGKWWLLVRARGLRISYPRLLGLTLIGIMYGTVLPGQLAGEVVKIHRLTRGSEQAGILAATVLVDRITGLIGLLIVGVVALVTSAPSNNSAWIVIFVGTLTLGLGCVFMVWVARGYSDEVQSAERKRHRVISIVRAVFSATVDFRQHPTQLVVAIVLSTIFQAVGIASVAFSAEAINLDVSIWALGWIFAVISILMMIPISVAGIGPREGALVLLLGGYGVSASDAISLSILILAGIFAVAIAGAGVEALGLTHLRKDNELTVDT